MKILSVKINNILSIADASIDFSDSGMVLVDGWNYDDDRANGAGKTAIFNALAFGLYNKVPRKITASEILRIGTKKGFVEVTLFTGTYRLVVRRERPNNLMVTLDGVPTVMSQEELEKLYKINYNHFLLAMYASQSATEKFILLNDSGKKDELLKLLDLEVINSLKVRFADKLSKLETDCSTCRAEIAALQSNIELIQGLMAEGASLDRELDEIRQQLRDIESQLDKYADVPRPDFSRYVEIERAIDNKRDKLSSIKYQRAEKINEHAKLLTQRRKVTDLPAISCPCCNEDLHIIGSGLVKSSDHLARTLQIKSHNDDIDIQAHSLAGEIGTLSQQELQLQNTVDGAITKLAELKQKESAEFYGAQNNINRLQSNKVRLEGRESFLLSKKQQHKGYEKKLEALSLQVVDKQRIEASLLENIAIISTQLSIVSPTGLPAYIMDSIVDRLNDKVSEHMAVLWPNATYKLQSYRENKSGEVRAKFSETIIIAGKERSLGSLSGGELSSVSLAVDLAFSDIVEQLVGVSLNPLVLDEPLDGMDAVSRERAIELLESISANKQVLIIDHASEVRSMFSNVIRVEKRNEVSSVIQ